MTGDIVPVELPLDALRHGDQHRLHKRPRQELLDDQELVLIPVLAMESLNVQPGHRLFNRF